MYVLVIFLICVLIKTAMKNIFDFATKELSQDAFLSWFIASYNELEVSEYSYKFINFLTGYQFNVGDIKKVTIKQQCDDIDIAVDFWTNDDLHYVLIIEDKTTSSAHTSQLEKYAKTMDGWNNNEEGYINRRRKVFYKVNHLTNQDKKELEIGNRNMMKMISGEYLILIKFIVSFLILKKQNLKY